MDQIPPHLPTVSIRVPCGCGAPRSLPIRLVRNALAHLRAQAGEMLQPDEPVMTYRCRHCKQIVVLRARDLYLAD